MTTELSEREIDSILERLDRLDDAAAIDLERKLALRPRTQTTNATRAIVLLQCGRLAEAMNILQDVSSAGEGAVVRYALASAAFQSGSFGEAAEHATAALEHPVLRDDAQLFRASALLQLGRNEELLQNTADSALEDTAHGTVLALQGQAALALGYLEEAVGFFVAAEQFLPAQLWIRQHRQQLEAMLPEYSPNIRCVIL